MNTDLLSTALALADQDLLASLPVLAAGERTATAQLVAHLAALRLRPSLYAAQGYGSLFAYCRHALRLSEDTAANRIAAAKACLKFPLILPLLASGELSLSAVRMLRPHLTAENHERVLARARNARRVDIERLVAELAPRPDVPASVRMLPQPVVQPLLPNPEADRSRMTEPQGVAIPGGPTQTPNVWGVPAQQDDPVSRPTAPTRRGLVQALSPKRYRVQFTIGQEGHDLLRRLQTLLRREIPDGDPGAIFEQALRAFHEQVEASKFGKLRSGKSRKKRAEHPVARGMDTSAETAEAAAMVPTSSGAYANRIRPAADTPARAAWSRYVPKAVRRAVWYRDRARCAFVSTSGMRCSELDFLELHHLQPFALKGPATVENMALRCRRHNAYEAEQVFGPGAPSARSSAG